MRRRLIVAATIAALAIPALPAVADQEGDCPSVFELLQEGVNYQVGTFDFEDRNEDGFICLAEPFDQGHSGGTAPGIIVDNTLPLP